MCICLYRKNDTLYQKEFKNILSRRNFRKQSLVIKPVLIYVHFYHTCNKLNKIFHIRHLLPFHMWGKERRQNKTKPNQTRIKYLLWKIFFSNFYPLILLQKIEILIKRVRLLVLCINLQITRGPDIQLCTIPGCVCESVSR